MLLASFGVLLATSSPSDWTRVDSVRATGFERVANGRDHPFTIVRDRSSLAYSCTRDLDGQLEGRLRTEVSGPKGVFTWLDANPKWVLQLPYMSAPDFADAILPLKVNRDDLQSNPEEVNRKLGKHVSEVGEDSVASRDCLVLALAGEGSMRQSLWVDAQTGMTLREDDKIGKDVVYTRLLTSFQPDPFLPPATFDPYPDAVIIKGLVQPSILIAAQRPRTEQEYRADIAKLRRTSSIKSGAWIKQLVLPEGLSYMGTSASEWDPNAIPPPLTFQQAPPQKLYADVGSFSGIPPAWAVAGQVAITGGSIYFGFNAPSEQSSRPIGDYLLNGIGRSASGPSSQPVAFGGFVGADGSVYMPPPPTDDQNQGADEETPKAAPLKDNLSSIVRSEFLDPATGDTLTFIQIHNETLRSALEVGRLPAPKALKDEKLPQAMSYEMASPWHENLITWRVANTEYALAGTKTSVADLQKLGEGV